MELQIENEDVEFKFSEAYFSVIMGKIHAGNDFYEMKLFDDHFIILNNDLYNVFDSSDKSELIKSIIEGELENILKVALNSRNVSIDYKNQEFIKFKIGKVYVDLINEDKNTSVIYNKLFDKITNILK